MSHNHPAPAFETKGPERAHTTLVNQTRGTAISRRDALKAALMLAGTATLFVSATPSFLPRLGRRI